MFANEEGVEAGVPQPQQIVAGAQAGLADGDTMVRNEVDQFA